jgi:hypothetical protein
MTAAPIIPAPTLKPLPALEVALAGAEDEAFEAADEAADEAAVVAGAVLDEMAAVVVVPEEMVVVTADDALVTAEAAEELAVDAADAVLDGVEAAVVEAPLARAIEQISLVTLVVAVGELSVRLSYPQFGIFSTGWMIMGEVDILKVSEVEQAAEMHPAPLARMVLWPGLVHWHT